MLFTSLPPRGRTAITLLAAVVLAITILMPDADSTPRGPLGVVVTNTGGQLTVRTGDGRTHAVDVDPYAARQCTPGRTFPSCSH